MLSTLEVGADSSVDSYVVSVARELGIPVIGLESMRQQMHIAFNLPRAEMYAFLELMDAPDAMLAAMFESDELTLDQLAHYYETNDFAAILENIALTALDNDCPYDNYMLEMLQGWRSMYYGHAVARLLRNTEEPTTFFVAVGLLHVISSGAGEDFTDLLQVLEREGFTIEPLWR